MIEILRTTSQFEIFRQNNCHNKTIGIVPTMGKLHKGHLSLVKESIRNNDITVVTIFVNPKQFGPSEDFEKYPRALGEDANRLKELYRSEGLGPISEKRLAIFAPETVEEIYPKEYSTNINVSGITTMLCGKSRVDHFQGVTTVVYQLFSIVRPQKAYFGQKDFQQYIVIKKMIEDLRLNIQIIPMPIKRDDDGLALSSRNDYLSTEQRQQALTLPKVLNEIKSLVKNNNWENIQQQVLSSKRIVKNDSQWEYLEILDAKNLEPVSQTTHTLIIAGAYKIGSTRLIDNKLVEINYA
jgi:pantoate--beta-alanine ligase